MSRSSKLKKRMSKLRRGRKKIDEDDRNDDEEDDDGNWKRKGRGNGSLENHEDNLVNDTELYNFESTTESNTDDLNITSIEGTASNEIIENDGMIANNDD